MKIEIIDPLEATEKFGVICQAFSFTLFTPKENKDHDPVMFVTMHMPNKDLNLGCALGTIEMTKEGLEMSIKAFQEALEVLKKGTSLGENTKMKILIPNDQQN